MKKFKLLLSYLFLASFFSVVSAQTLNQSFLFDFGPIDTTNGVATSNPDANNNYWNIITTASGAGGTGAPTLSSTTPAFSNLVNSANAASSYGLAFVRGSFSINGILNGGLIAPVASNFGTNTELAIATATEDYMFSAANSSTAAASVPTFKITGLDVTKKYKFKIFGSRSGTVVKTSQYTLQGDGTAVVGTLNTSDASGANLGNVYVSDYVVPNASGEISIAVISAVSTSGYYAYLNCMKMEEYNDSTTGLNNIDAENQINVYPRKVESSLHISGATKSVEIFNTNGMRVISCGAVSNLNMSNLEKGIYIVRVDNNKSVKISKL